jgi:hypothetical protein
MAMTRLFGVISAVDDAVAVEVTDVVVPAMVVMLGVQLVNVRRIDRIINCVMELDINLIRLHIDNTLQFEASVYIIAWNLTQERMMWPRRYYRTIFSIKQMSFSFICVI